MTEATETTELVPWTRCPHCKSDKTQIKDRDLEHGSCECGANDPSHIYGDPELAPECACPPEQLEDRLAWSLYCKSCRQWFTAYTETDRY